jgi:hypothetical protein
MAVKVELTDRGDIQAKPRNGDQCHAQFRSVLDRVRPQAALAVASIFSVAWIAAFDYGLLRPV